MSVRKAATTELAAESDGRRRVAIEQVTPKLEEPGFPIKRVIGDSVYVEADIFADGHDLVSAEIIHRTERGKEWEKAPLTLLGNDRFGGSFVVFEVGRHFFTVRGWVDEFRTWTADLRKRLSVGQDLTVDLAIGAQIVGQAASLARGRDHERLSELAFALKSRENGAVELALSEELSQLMKLYPDLHLATLFEPLVEIWVDRPLAGFSSWYETFPRSWSPDRMKQGTLEDLRREVPAIAEMGFNVLYLPPIHPIGHTNRKGKNNSPICQANEPGSPWAIGNEFGGHKAIDPALGTFDDFRALLEDLEALDMEVALDIALQCSPDHPYIREHPQWFSWRPDHTIQYAENPPKKYQDIYPLNFKCDDWFALWQELKSVFFFWIEQGVKIFRVDNPHTKPFAFWQWLIAEIHNKDPNVILLAEAFTRPDVMYRLAKIGFTQSYTYFAWKNSKQELTSYFEELTRPPTVEFFRPNLWPNTPDILNEYLQHGRKPAFMIRLILAATLSSNFGIYGPPFELCLSAAKEPGSEEYLNSEKYELKHWDLEDRENLRDLITRVNQIRRANPALHQNRTLRFHSTDNDRLISYSKSTAGGENVILTVVSLDTYWRQGGFVQFSPSDFTPSFSHCCQIQDLLTGQSYTWNEGENYVELDPQRIPAHIFLLQPV